MQRDVDGGIMTEGEIVAAFRQAAEPMAQRVILAELNDTSVERIDEILRSGGVFPEELPELAGVKPRRPRAELEEAAARALYGQGKNDREIAQALGVSKSCVRNWRKRRGLPPNDSWGRKKEDDDGGTSGPK